MIGSGFSGKRLLQGFLPGVFFLTGLVSCASKDEASIQWLLAGALLDQIRSIHIIGDSLTHYSRGFDLESKLEPSDDFHYIGITGSGFLEWTVRIDQAMEAAGPRAPDIIFVPLGTNDGYQHNPDLFLQQFQEFHRELRIRSSARIYYFQVPRTRDTALSGSIQTNNQILSKNLPGDSTGMINMDHVFWSNQPETLYPPDDAIHPTEFGYALFATEILKHL